MVRKILGGIALVLVLFAGVVATRPGAFHIERSVVMAAPPETPFALVDHLRSWAGWSPFEKLDPQMKRTFEGPSSGNGAVYAWAGNDNAGEGRMTIERSEKPTEIRIKLEFIKPFAATNIATFTFIPTAQGSTKVTWAMDGERNFIAKGFALFMDMDKLIGSEFERGLAALQTLSESAPGATSARE